ncbi:MAG: hypothetical protein ACE5EU_03495 [Paracoccaceae bacterium]
MRFSRNALYVVAGSAMLMAATVLNIAQKNLQFVDWRDFWLTFGAVAGLSGLIVLIAALAFPRRLSIAAALGLVNWLSIYHVKIGGLIQSLAGSGAAAITPGAVVVILLLGCPVLILVVSLFPRDLYARVIGAGGLAIFALAAVQLVTSRDFIGAVTAAPDPKVLVQQTPLPDADQAAGRLPDIIYIVPDRYGNSAALEAGFRHDNSAFVGGLRRRGFLVADAARANYSNTPYSIASMMNMQYLEPMLQRLDGEVRRIEPIYSLIRENLVVARLKQMGYRYVHVASFWDGTRKSPQADLTVDLWSFDFGGEFSLAVFQQMPLLLLAVATVSSPDRCAALKRQLSYLEGVGGEDQPTFVFAHLLVPHAPILTDADGNCISPMEYPVRPRGVTWEAFREGFSGFLSYFNTRILEIFDRQKAHNPNPLIFVIQADEGPYPKAYRESILGGRDRPETEAEPFDWQTASDAQLLTKFGIINALYLGGASDGGAEVPQTMTPVNNWRVIFGHLDGTVYPMLPDRHFMLPDQKELYRLIDFTERLNAIP